ncbi:MAG: hypothetical protein HDS03_06555 [Bacteroides sp.]|nr:hypothetical protein [Bacteroides sp.]
MNIIEAMKERRSVRNFDGNGITGEQRRELLKAVEEAYDPFGGNVTIRLKKFDLKGGYKPSTYGMINGAEEFFLLGMGDDEASALSAGFRFEQVVLKAWEMGLGTCWIAGTFKGSSFEKGENWPDGEELKVVCPVGEAKKPSMMEKFTRFTLGSKNRKSFDTLFFSDSFHAPVSDDNQFHEALEMLRLSPSSTNSQPWRALVSDNTVHFYYKPKSRISALDTAIGMCQFWETERFNGKSGKFHKVSDAPKAPEDWKYLYSYTRE